MTTIIELKNSKQYLRMCRSRLTNLKQYELTTHDANTIGRIAFNLGFLQQFHNAEKYSLKEIIDLMLEHISKKLEED